MSGAWSNDQLNSLYIYDAITGNLILVVNSNGLGIYSASTGALLMGVTGNGMVLNAPARQFRMDTSAFTVSAVPDTGAYIKLTTAPTFGGVEFLQPENSTVAGTLFVPASIFADSIETVTDSRPHLKLISPAIDSSPDLATSQILLHGQAKLSASDDSYVEIAADSLQLGATRFSRPNVTYSFSKSIPTGVVTQIDNASYTVIRDNYPGLYNNGLFVPDRDGVWEFNIHARWQSQAAVTGQRQIRYQVNGVDVDYTSISPTTALNSTLVSIELNFTDEFNSGDQIGFQAFQNSGGALTLGNAAKVSMKLIED